jgi:putative mRNA 3-end processing factor
MEPYRYGLYCAPADAWIDPLRPVERAIITHGHADHARAGHGEVYATPETLAIMRTRYGASHTSREIPLPYGTRHPLPGGVTLRLAPAGHILGSAQAVLDYQNSRIVVSGDYKRMPDPTCIPFEPVPCDVFVTEATFGLPVFHHPPLEQEIATLLDSLRVFPTRCHLVGVYALGKCQRLMAALRTRGYERPVYLHGALVALTELYEQYGLNYRPWQKVSEVQDKSQLAGEIVLAPPSALVGTWAQKLPDVLPAMASGWMQIRARARQRRAELPIVVSDHADWPQLLQTLHDVGAPEIWVTHGREDALVYQAQQMGFTARALSMVGYEDSDNEQEAG